MATTVRNSSWGGATTQTSELLQAYITDIVRVLEPDLQWARLGKRVDPPRGYDRIVFPQTNQLPVKINTSMVTVGGPGGAAGGGSVWGSSGSIQGGEGSDAGGYPVSSTVGVAAITEGTNPTSVTWGSRSFSSGPAQYGILVAVSDLLVRNSAIEVIDNASIEVRNALARMVDTVIQTVVNAGSNGVIYSGGKTTRASLGASDTIAQSDVQRGVMQLRSANAAGLKPFADQFYVGVIGPHPMYDLMNNTGAGSWIDAARFTSIEQILDGKMKDYRGVRYLETGYVNYFASTVPVAPTTLVGKDSFGWGFFQEPTAMMITTPDSNNPLNLYNSISGKVTLGVTRFEDTIGTVRIARIESAFTTA